MSYQLWYGNDVPIQALHLRGLPDLVITEHHRTLWENPIPILWMKKLRLQMIKQLAQSHDYQMVEWGFETQTYRLAISLCLFSNFVLIL